MDLDSTVEVHERSNLLSPQSDPATPSPGLLGVTPTGVAIWRTFETRRSSAEWYLDRYYEHLNALALNEPIANLDAALAAAAPGTHQSQHLNGLKVCVDRVIRDVFMMEEILAYVQEVRSELDAPKQLAIPGVAAVGSLTTIGASAWFLPAKIATWVALSSVGVAVSTVMVGWTLWPRDLNKHYQGIQTRIQSFRCAVERCDVVEINKQQIVLEPKTFAHLKSDLMYHWPKGGENDS
ncbi:hypothetical protein QBC41DRAFT_55150 [Cercophora samala]|uniref:Transmembrane protein n=1 Tax=Cercophora samala TaxID=330535 RepID=A0AA40DE02_9PEZI|nr:hypothetical protein QBC41DRAFT_55150 [Cercophora samala]